MTTPATAPRGQTRLGRTAANCALAAASVVVCALLFEFALRWFVPGIAPDPVTGDQYEFYRFDPALGWSNEPNARGTFRRPEFSYALRINSQGLRGPEIDVRKPAGVRRIAVLGDSFTWGIGATEAEVFPTLIEQAIPGSQVLNFGVAGYGPIQYDLQTRRVLEFSPDVVVIAFCLGNDFADNVFWRRYSYYKPFARLDEGGNLVIEGYPLPNIRRYRLEFAGAFARWLDRHSYLARLFDDAVLNGLGRPDRSDGSLQKGPDFDYNQADIYVRPEAPVVDQVLAVNRKLFEQMTAAYAAQGIPVVVVAVPTQCEFGGCFPDSKNDAARLALARSLDKLPLTLIDPTSRFSPADFWERDGHWRPSGHRKIADAAVPTIRRLLDGLRPSP